MAWPKGRSRLNLLRGPALSAAQVEQRARAALLPVECPQQRFPSGFAFRRGQALRCAVCRGQLVVEPITYPDRPLGGLAACCLMCGREAPLQ